VNHRVVKFWRHLTMRAVFAFFGVYGNDSTVCLSEIKHANGAIEDKTQG